MKKNFILIYRVLLFIIILCGIILNFFAKDFNLNLLLSYYTIQSNIIILIVLLLKIINHFKKIKLFKNEETFNNINGACTIIILITGLIFSILLSKYTKDWSGYRLYSSYVLHYISPLLVLIDYLFFDPTTYKTDNKKILLWLIYPLLYYIFGVIRILYLDGFIPYPFMNVKELGFIKSILIVVVLIIIFYLISILLSKAKNKINKILYKFY